MTEDTPMPDTYVPRNEYREDLSSLKADFRMALHEAMAPIVGQLDLGREEIRAMKEQIKLQNGRVTRLEQWRWTLLGAGAVVMFLLDRVWLK